MRVRRRRDHAHIPRARNGREQDALTHTAAMRAGLGADEGDAQIGRAARGEGKGHHGAESPVFILEGEGRRGEAGEEVGRDEDLDAVFLRVDVVLWVRAGDEDAAVLEEDGFGVVEAGDDGVAEDGDAGADGLGGVVEEGVEVGSGGEAEAGGALLGAVEDEEGAVGEGADARHDALRGHALQGPLRGCGFGLRGDAIVEGDAGVRGRSTADEHRQGVRVGRVLGQEDGGSFERICAAAEEVVDGAWDVGQLLRCCKGSFVQDPGFVVVSDEDSARRQHSQIRIEVPGVRAVQVIRVENRVTRDWVGKDLYCGNRSSVGTTLAANHEDGPVRHDHRRGIPAPLLERQLGHILLPIVRWAARPIQSDAEGRIIRPPTNIDLSSGLIWQGKARGTKNVSLDTVHRPPRRGKVVDLGDV